MAAAGVMAALFAGSAASQETAPTAAAPDPDAVVGTVNGLPVTNREIDFALGDLADQLGQVPPDQ